MLSHVLDITELRVNGLVQFVEVLSQLLFGLVGGLELHLSQLVNQVGSEGLFDEAH
jgi:hypothetical protein